MWGTHGHQSTLASVKRRTTVYKLTNQWHLTQLACISCFHACTSTLKGKDSLWGYATYLRCCKLSFGSPTIQHTKLPCWSPPLYSWALPSLSATSRRWAAFSISFVGCLQVLYLGMFGKYSLAFGPLCSHTINNKPSSQQDMCAFVGKLLKQVHTHSGLFSRRCCCPHSLLIDAFSSQFFLPFPFFSFLMKQRGPTFCWSLNRIWVQGQEPQEVPAVPLVTGTRQRWFSGWESCVHNAQSLREKNTKKNLQIRRYFHHIRPVLAGRG